MSLQILYLIYMYKQDLAFDNLQGWIYHKTQPTKPKFYKNCLKNLSLNFSVKKNQRVSGNHRGTLS